jgi:hypothetical protein
MEWFRLNSPRKKIAWNKVQRMWMKRKMCKVCGVGATVKKVEVTALADSWNHQRGNKTSRVICCDTLGERGHFLSIYNLSHLLCIIKQTWRQHLVLSAVHWLTLQIPSSLFNKPIILPFLYLVTEHSKPAYLMILREEMVFRVAKYRPQ